MMRNPFARLIQWLAVKHGYIHKDAITVSGEYVRADDQPFGPNTWLDANESDLSEYGLECREQERQRRIEYIIAECNRLQFHPIDETRIRMGDDAKARSHRWQAFAVEEGGLFDMIEALRRETFEQASEIPPEEVAKLQYAAMSDRNLRRLKQRVQSIITQGKIQERNEAKKPVQILKSV